jgi:hypothetical protein
MRYQSDLTTIEAVNRQLIKADPGDVTSPGQDQYDEYFLYLEDVIPEVSDYIATECGISFVPYREAKSLYFQDIAEDELYDARRRLLTLPDSLIIASSVVWNGQTLAPTDYRQYPTDEYAGWGMLFSGSPSVPLLWSTGFNDAIVIDGTWGWTLNGTQAYTTIDASVTLADDTIDTIDVADASRYEILQYVRCESELMQVVSKAVNADPASDTITVRRGVNGHTAAAHTAKALQVYNTVRGLKHVATRMAAYLYQKRLDVGGTVQVGESAFLLDALPATVKAVLKQRQQWSFGHI